MKKLLIICTGNTCRSPMAGELAKDWFRKTGELGAEIKTAGLAVYPDAPATEQGIEVMAEKGLDLTGHKANQLTEELVDWADLIMTMTWSHKQRLLSLYPHALEKTHTLGEYSSGNPALDIDDPFGGSVETYRNTAEMLERLLPDALARFQKKGRE